MKTLPWIATSELANPASIDAEDAVQAASFILFELSGQKYAGIQQTTEQYFCEESGAPIGCRWDPGDRRWWNPFFNVPVYQIDWGPTHNSTFLWYGKQFRLRNRPVTEIVELKVGDTVIDPTHYELLDSAILKRTGEAWSPCEAPTVTYNFGVRPPALGRMAARRLANELILAANDSADCALPTGVTNVSRQGIDLKIFDPMDFMDKGKTGLYEVDLFIATVNPGGARARSRVFSPDMRRGYRKS